MSQTAPTPVDALPTPPHSSAPSVFAARTDTFLAALAAFVSQINAIATNAYNNAVDAFNNAVAAAASAVSAAASAATATSAAAVTKWISGTSYTEGNNVWSPVNYQTYRRKSNGAGTTDPSADSANWALLGVLRAWAVKTAAYTAVSGDRILADTNAVGAWSLTLPPTPTLGDEVTIEDYAGTFHTANLTVLRNGEKIESVADDWLLTVRYFSRTLVYTGSTHGWRFR